MEETSVIYKEILLQLKNYGKSDDKNISGDKGISDEFLSILNCVFPTILEAALDLVDNSSVTHVECPKGRSFYQVF